MRRRQPAQRISRARARHQRRDDRPAHPQAQARGPLPGGPAGPLLQGRQGGGRGGLRDGDVRRFHEEGRARGVRHGRRPHECDPGLVREPYHLAREEISGICPGASRLLGDAEADAPAYLDFPCAHHGRLRTNNVQERANRGLERRSRVVQVFPSRRSPIRMLGAVFSEMDEDWEARRWFPEEPIARALDSAAPAAPSRAYEGTAEENARCIIDVVLADNPIGRRAA